MNPIKQLDCFWLGCMLSSAWEEVELGCLSWRVLWTQLQSSLTIGCPCMGWVHRICVCMRLWCSHLKRDREVHSSWIQKRKSLFHNWYLFILFFFFLNVHHYYSSSELPANCSVGKRPHRHCRYKQVMRTRYKQAALCLENGGYNYRFIWLHFLLSI